MLPLLYTDISRVQSTSRPPSTYIGGQCSWRTRSRFVSVCGIRQFTIAVSWLVEVDCPRWW